MTEAFDEPGEAILTVLADRPELSPADLAESLGIGHSTAARRLAALERAGKVRRRAGGQEGSRRLPARWSIAPVRATPTADSDVAPDRPDGIEPASERLGRGQLAQLVRGELAAHAS